MARKGPIITLLGGLAVASVLIALDVNATSHNDKPSAAAQTSVTKNTPPASASPGQGGANVDESSAPVVTLSAAPAPSSSRDGSAPPIANRATYAGYTTGGAATVAIAIRDGKAIAYICDGSKVEAWLSGTATADGLKLTGTNHSSLTATFGKGVVTGQVTIGAKHWTFKAKAVYPPSGLYKAAAEVRGAKLEGTWIIVNGRQVGVADVNGVPGPAPVLDTGTRTATVNGATVTAVPVDGSTGSGF
jgi:serine/threonine-protein kinase